MHLRLTAGRVLFGIAVLFLAFDALIKVMALPMAVEGTLQLGYPAGTLVPIGYTALACLVLFVIPRTAPLGAILWTAYLGGAVASQVRMGAPLFGFTLFPVYVAAIIWTSLYLRDPRVRQLIRAAH